MDYLDCTTASHILIAKTARLLRICIVVVGMVQQRAYYEKSLTKAVVLLISKAFFFRYDQQTIKKYEIETRLLFLSIYLSLISD